MRKVIVNTTPLIALAGIGQLDLLRQLYSEITIPRAVNHEVISEPARSLVSAVQIPCRHRIPERKWNHEVSNPLYKNI